MVKLSFFGGQNEIGGNKILLEDGDTRLFLDFGQSFTAEGNFFDQPFLSPQNTDDLRLVGAIPDVDGLYKNAGYRTMYDDEGFVGVCGTGEPKKIMAVLVSHAHTDHAGYLGIIRKDMKFYGSKITKTFLGRRRDISEGWMMKYDDDSFTGLDDGETFEVGSAKIKHISVDHSIPGASAFIIEMGGLLIGYTGDLRLHGRRRELTEKFVKEAQNAKLDYLFCEGTRVDDGRTADPELQAEEAHSLHSEEQVASKLETILDRAKGMVIYDASPADMDRMDMVIRIASQKGRNVLIDAKKAYLVHGINLLSGLYPELEKFDNCSLLLSRKKERMPKPETTSKPRKGADPEKEARKDALREADFNNPDIYIETRYNGRMTFEKDIMTVFEEFPNNCILPRIVWGPALRDEIIKNQDNLLIYTSMGPLSMMHAGKGLKGTYVYGKAEPFNEEMEISFRKLENWIDLFGMELDYAHTSGHANRRDLEYIVNKIAPRWLLPIHTCHAGIFDQFYKSACHWPNGAKVELTKDGPKLIESEI